MLLELYVFSCMYENIVCFQFCGACPQEGPNFLFTDSVAILFLARSSCQPCPPLHHQLTIPFNLPRSFSLFLLLSGHQSLCSTLSSPCVVQELKPCSFTILKQFPACLQVFSQHLWLPTGRTTGSNNTGDSKGKQPLPAPAKLTLW